MRSGSARQIRPRWSAFRGSATTYCSRDATSWTFSIMRGPSSIRCIAGTWLGHDRHRAYADRMGHRGGRGARCGCDAEQPRGHGRGSPAEPASGRPPLRRAVRGGHRLRRGDRAARGHPARCGALVRLATGKHRRLRCWIRARVAGRRGARQRHRSGAERHPRRRHDRGHGWRGPWGGDRARAVARVAARPAEPQVVAPRHGSRRRAGIRIGRGRARALRGGGPEGEPRPVVRSDRRALRRGRAGDRPPVSAVNDARARDGIALRTYRWPAVGVPRAHLLLVHGIAEHAGRYQHVAAQLAAAGIETHAYDQRGFGGSGGHRAYVDRWSQYHDDLEDRLAEVRASAGSLPVVLYGHSMGGLIALGYALADPPRPLPDTLVLSAPALDATVAGWQRRLADILARTVPRFAVANTFPKDGL